MPKNCATSRQRFLKKEKAKTKLKSKKELPKGTNVTKTNFKVKKIILREQLKTYRDYEILSSRKLNISDLFSRVHHHNVGSRLDAVNGIKEIITSYDGMIEKNLMGLIRALTPLVIDVDSKVRREALKTLHLVLSNAPEEMIEPKFDFLRTYLRSAMTHINIKIREDSVNFMKILLSCLGGIMAKNFHRIIPNFLNMISSLRVDSRPGRILTVYLQSRIENVKWRTSVLQHLHQFLEKYVEINTPANNVDALDKITHIYNDNKVNNYPLFNPKFITISPISYFDLENYEQPRIFCNETEQFSNLLKTLLPLLFEAWVEVCPKSPKDTNIETVLPHDAAVLLKNILGLLHIIWKLVVIMQNKHPDSNFMELFQRESRISYSQHVFNLFPYLANMKFKKSHITDFFKDTVVEPDMIQDNLLVCYLYILLNPKVSHKNANEVAAVIKYMDKIMDVNIKEDNVCELIIKILNVIFGDNITGWNRNPKLLHGLFNKMFANANKTRTFNEDLSNLISNIALNEKYSDFHKNKLFIQWVSDLPKILLKDTVTHKSLDVILSFAVRCNEVFNSAIHPLLMDIVNNLPNIKVLEPTVKSQGYIKLLGLLYWINSWSNEVITLIETQIMENKYTQEDAKFIISILTIKSQGTLIV